MNMEVFTQFGFAGLITALFYIVLKWQKSHQDEQFKIQKEILAAADAERKAWQGVISAMKENLILHTGYARTEIEGFKVGDKYQREEHAKMLEQHQHQIDTLISIKDTLCQCKENLEEQGKVLTRINGTKIH